VPSSVWQGMDAVRLSGRTNMLDRPVVADLAAQMGFSEATVWIMKKPTAYSRGVFAGFLVEDEDNQEPVNQKTGRLKGVLHVPSQWNHPGEEDA